ncbi:MAG TPA: GAF domain-containing protein [Gemmatimonadales bacterium]|nr:GAF domain-containing protein [Gemmatimonadales bacterium]
MSVLSRDAPPSGPAPDEIRSLATLLEIGQLLAAAPHPRSALSRVLEILSGVPDILRSTITLIEAETGHLVVEASQGVPADGQRARYRVGEGITGRVVASGQPIIVPEVSREPLFLHRAVRRRTGPGDEVSFICVPLLAGRRAIGALAVDLRYEPQRDYDATTRFLGVVAAQLTQALQRATPSTGGTAGPLRTAVAALETNLIVEALKSSQGNRAKAARMLDTTERILNYKVRKYGIDPARFR